MRYRLVVEELPALSDSGRRLRRIAAVTDSETISTAFEHTDETWSIGAASWLRIRPGFSILGRWWRAVRTRPANGWSCWPACNCSPTKPRREPDNTLQRLT